MRRSIILPQHTPFVNTFFQKISKIFKIAFLLNRSCVSEVFQPQNIGLREMLLHTILPIIFWFMHTLYIIFFIFICWIVWGYSGGQWHPLLPPSRHSRATSLQEGGKAGAHIGAPLLCKVQSGYAMHNLAVARQWFSSIPQSHLSADRPGRLPFGEGEMSAGQRGTAPSVSVPTLYLCALL